MTREMFCCLRNLPQFSKCHNFSHGQYNRELAVLRNLLAIRYLVASKLLQTDCNLHWRVQHRVREQTYSVPHCFPWKAIATQQPSVELSQLYQGLIFLEQQVMTSPSVKPKNGSSELSWLQTDQPSQGLVIMSETLNKKLCMANWVYAD